jgi:5-methyltetrahydrofolate--homocysteine methyltransferase
MSPDSPIISTFSFLAVSKMVSVGTITPTKADYETVRQRRANKGKSKLISLEKARANKPNPSFNTIVKPKKLGIHVFKDYDLAEIFKFIDWVTRHDYILAQFLRLYVL